MHVGIAYPRWRGKRSRHSRRMSTRNFTHLARGPNNLKEIIVSPKECLMKPEGHFMIRISSYQYIFFSVIRIKRSHCRLISLHLARSCIYNVYSNMKRLWLQLKKKFRFVQFGAQYVCPIQFQRERDELILVIEFNSEYKFTANDIVGRFITLKTGFHFAGDIIKYISSIKMFVHDCQGFVIGVPSLLVSICLTPNKQRFKTYIV